MYVRVLCVVLGINFARLIGLAVSEMICTKVSSSRSPLLRPSSEFEK